MLKAFKNTWQKAKTFQGSKTKWLWYILFCLVGIWGYWLIGYELTRVQSGKLILSFGVLFLSYGLIISQKWDDLWIKRLVWIAVGFRLLLLFSVPVLSDDYFRFIWDGRLLATGHNPYLYLPSEIIHSSIANKAQLNELLFRGLNSPNYFTVYPPLNQLMFGLAAWIAGDNSLFNIMVLRIFILLAEIGIIWLMSSMPVFSNRKKANNTVLIYALNPIVIIELMGNLHFEAVTLFFVLLALKWINKPFEGDKHYVGSATALALGVAVKLLPLIFLPLVVKRLGIRRGMIYSVIVGSVLLVCFAPFLSNELLLNISQSLDLYFQKFEFNASIYYLLRQFGYWLMGYNLIQSLGPFLSLLTLACVLWLTFQRRSLLEKMLLALTVYFLLATTVHPWYITTLVAFGALTGRWYPVVWSALLPLTYIAYASQPYEENLRVVTLEYILVIGCLCYEVFLKGLDWEAS
jgi:alpha-1,6-mannosyltransferase